MATHEDRSESAGNVGAGEEGSAALSAVAEAISGLALRSIGPAFMGGRIADIAVDPRRSSTWYVAVGSGGVWKTTNAGTTWSPLFDDQGSYSIGCVTIDPNQPDVIWVGTGEAVSGRHVAWGDGVYRSRDGGTTWARMGLERSEHIAEILVDPRDSDVVYVAAEGPLWSAGGERGLFKTADGGSTWDAILDIDEDTGVTSVAFAPGNPDVIYAATYQRRRRAWSFLGGGPGSGIHKSADAGATWVRVSEGLPEGDMGKIGLAVTPAAPDVVFATIEADTSERGFYRSADRGESWERRSDYISGGTGPHYYQEIVASPVDADLVYQVDVFLHVTRNGGSSFQILETGREKHSDNHVVWIDPDDGDHLLVGTDAGLYETFDEGVSFRHFANLPVSQFYRVALDNSLPFFNILGGAQDLGTVSGPSRTMQLDGVRNQDWYVPLGADGYHVAFDPVDPDISYLEWQTGNVMRHDRRTMELQDIRPQPEAEEPPERWNWDTPILVSPHDPHRIYVASQRVWRSDDRGESWRAISADLTAERNRYELPTFDHVASVDSLYDHEAMSLYSTITHVTESPITEGLLYVGTDDGQIQLTEDAGAGWQRAGSLPGAPADAFINDVEASQHDGDTVFATADAHKNGDYSPYVFESRDRGRTWRSIRGDLPDGTIVWAIEQDHVDPGLLFLGTENGIYVTIDSGETWHKFTRDVPTIAFRDIKLHRRDDDLVGASFGRGMYVLDDYSPLRRLVPEALATPAALFPVRDAWRYIPFRPMQSVGQPTLGSSAFRAENPPFGATITYRLGTDLLSAKKQRLEIEQDRDAGGSKPVDVAFPGWDTLWEEHLEVEPQLFLVIRNGGGTPIRRIEAATTAGLHRTTWDLRLPPPTPIKLATPDFEPPWNTPQKGPLAPVGEYSAELVRVSSGNVETLAGPELFTVKATPATAGQHNDEGAAFQVRAADLARRVAGAAKQIEVGRDRLTHLRAALVQTPGAAEDLFATLEAVHRQLEELDRTLRGDPVRARMAEAPEASIRALIDRVMTHLVDTTLPPTRTQHRAVEQAAAAFSAFTEELETLIGVDLAGLVADIDAAGGPWTPR
jgi:photosystem II stability/assembly factor-like uncharacterized protein